MRFIISIVNNKHILHMPSIRSDMKNFVIRFYFLMLMSNNVLTIMMEPNSNNDNQRKASHVVQFDDPSSFNEALQSCLAERNYGTIECFNRGALTTLQSWNDNDCLDFGNIKLERSDAESRNFLNFEEDSSNIVNLIKATSKLLESRNIKWDLGNIYPGLQMRVGPTLSASNGLLEFVMDERGNHYVNNRQIGTGKLLMRQLLLPFLLGFKLNLTALLPLLFGALIIITKKALLLTKVALFIAGLIDHDGVNYGYTQNINLQPGFGNDLASTLGTMLHNPIHQYNPYRVASGNHFPINQHITREVFNVYETKTNDKSESFEKNKDFVWSRN